MKMDYLAGSVDMNSYRKSAPQDFERSLLHDAIDLGFSTNQCAPVHN